MVEYISSTELIFKYLEQTNQPDAIKKALVIRTLLLFSHKKFTITIKSNLSAEESEIIQGLKNDVIIICLK